MPLLSEILSTTEALWPAALAEDWDAPGLICGSTTQNVTKVMLTVDVTSEVVDAALEAGVNLLIAHHPFIMRGVTALSEATSKGATLAKAIRADLAIYAAHTNADVVIDGVSDVLAKRLGIRQAISLSDPSSEVGIGRVGELADSTTLGEFAKLVARTLPATATGVRVAGDYNQTVKRVAVCGGAGDSMLPAAVAANADVYLTADLRHHVSQDAREAALLRDGTPALIDVSHWSSEFLWLDVAATQLRRIYPDMVFEVCDLRTDPWDFVVTQ